MMPLGVSPSPIYAIKRLKQKRETITVLVSALESFLAFDVDYEMEAMEQMAAAVDRPSITAEMLVSAQAKLANLESQADMFEQMRERIPDVVKDDFGPMFEVLQSMYNNVRGNSLEHQRETVKWMQNQLDGKTSSVMCACRAALMSDGSTNHGALNPYDFFMGTREEVEAKARECGWAVNGDEHKCPECAAK